MFLESIVDILTNSSDGRVSKPVVRPQTQRNRDCTLIWHLCHRPEARCLPLSESEESEMLT